MDRDDIRCGSGQLQQQVEGELGQVDGRAVPLDLPETRIEHQIGDAITFGRHLENLSGSLNDASKLLQAMSPIDI
jgi:hypothetical protein